MHLYKAKSMHYVLKCIYTCISNWFINIKLQVWKLYDVNIFLNHLLLHNGYICRLQIDLKGMTSKVTCLTLESLPTKTGRRTVIYNLSGQFRRNSSSYDGTVCFNLCRSVLFVEFLEPYFQKINTRFLIFIFICSIFRHAE